MKKIILLATLFLFLLTQNNSFAQVKEDIVFMSLGDQNAFHFDIESKDVKGLEKLWKKYFKDYGKMKKDKKEKEWKTKEAVNIPESGSVDYHVYFKLEKKNDITVAYLWAFDGDTFVSSSKNPTEASKILSMFEGYAHQTEVFTIEAILDNENDVLEGMEKDLKKLEKKNDGYHKKIEKAKKTITDNEENIEQNIEKQEQTNTEITDQRKRIKKVKDNLNAL